MTSQPKMAPPVRNNMTRLFGFIQKFHLLKRPLCASVPPEKK
ncbi:unnamed protein product [Knipowitschia caucasica]